VIYDTPRFLPAGDRFLLIELGNEMSLDLNFLAHGLAHAIAAERPRGVIETAPAYASLLVHYDPGEIGFDRLIEEMSALAHALGPSDAITLDSRLFYFPTAYLDPWSAEAVDRYIADVAPKTRDPALLVAANDLDDTAHLVRVHSATEYWVAAIGWWPGVPFMMPLDPRCRLTAPRYNPPRLWTKKGTVGVGGGTTGIYPEDLPGGIQVFARIPVPIWDRDQRFPIFEDSICLLRPGDRVKFVPCTLEEFEAVDRMVGEGTYPFNVVEYQTFSATNYRAWVQSIDARESF
jgi:KipI family sensor histidine kinase inhibitor